MLRGALHNELYNNNVNESSCNSSPIFPTKTTYIAVVAADIKATIYPSRVNSKSPTPASTPPSVVKNTAACTRPLATLPNNPKSNNITNGVVADFNTPYIGIFTNDNAVMSSTNLS